MDKKSIVLNTVEMISQLMGELEGKAFEAEGFSGITLRQMFYLETIALLEKPTFSDLAEHLQVTPPSVSAIVKKINSSGTCKQAASTGGRPDVFIITDRKRSSF